MAAPQRRTHRAKRLLDAVGHAYPGAWSTLDDLRGQRGSSHDFDWPDWCYLPIAGGIAIASGGDDARVDLDTAHDAAILAALSAWRMTQGVYRYDPALYAALIDTPLSGDMPAQVLYRMPEWCVHVETPGMRIGDIAIHGAWAHLEYNVARDGAAELRLLLDCADDPSRPLAPGALLAIPLILGAGGILDALHRVDDSAAVQSLMRGGRVPAKMASVDSVAIVAPILSLLLYLCSESPDLTRRGKLGTPANPEPKRTRRHGWRLFPASGPSEWDVGVRIGAALRDAYAREQTGGDAAPTGRHVRPHVRRAHWHTILSGPRKRDDGTTIPSAERRADLQWMPPIPINVDDVGELPTTIRRVR